VILLVSCYFQVSAKNVYCYYTPRYYLASLIIIINLFGLCCWRRNITYIFIYIFTYKRYMARKNKSPDKIKSSNTFIHIIHKKHVIYFER